MQCIGEIVNRIWKLHQWSADTPINVCGISCMGNLKGRISKWKWKWDARFRCDSKAPGIEGHGTERGRS